MLQPVFNTYLGQRLLSAFAGLRGACLLLLPALPLMLYTVTLQAQFPGTNDLIHDWYMHAMYFTIFLYGWCLARTDALWVELQRLRKPALVFALVCGGAYLSLVLRFKGTEEISFATQWLIWALRNAYVWATLCAILGWGHALLNRPFRWLGWATQSVYPWYMLHQSLIVLLAYWLVPLKLGPTVEPLLVGVGTVLGCWLLTSGLIVRIQWLRPLFGLKSVQRATAATNTTGKVEAY